MYQVEVGSRQRIAQQIVLADRAVALVEQRRFDAADVQVGGDYVAGSADALTQPTSNRAGARADLQAAPTVGHAFCPGSPTHSSSSICCS